MTTSARVLTTESHQPPINPAEKPSTMPTNMPIPAPINPTPSERGVPTIITASMSRPLLSVPSGWAGLAGLKVGLGNSSTQTGTTLVGTEPISAKSVFQNKGPINFIEITAITIASPSKNLPFNHGEFHRLKKGFVSSSGPICSAIVVVIPYPFL